MTFIISAGLLLAEKTYFSEINLIIEYSALHIEYSRINMLIPLFLEKIERYFRTHSIVALLGPRQCGKTTLTKQYLKNKKDFSRENYFDLEDPIDAQRLENAMLALRPLSGLIVIDEVQRRPELFPLLRVLIDDPQQEQRFLILGSASRDLIKQSSETLAGRIAYIELTPFSFDETHNRELLGTKVTSSSPSSCNLSWKLQL